MTTQSAQRDMGSGSVGRLLLQLAIPSVVAQVINLLYNIVDRIYIGHIPGTHADQRFRHDGGFGRRAPGGDRHGPGQ